MKRVSHLRVVDSLAGFDPTPEEVQKAERAKPTKRPLCIKCKSVPRIEVWETVSHRITDAFKAVDALLKSCRLHVLSRDDVARLRTFHELLCRASKARYCKHCVTSTVTYVIDSVAQMKNAGTL